MRTLLLSTAAVAAVVATPALAQSTGGPFTGARAGVILGYDKLQPGRGPDSDFGDRSADGFTYGGDVGYDIGLGQGGPLTLGAEGEITGSTTKTVNDPVDEAALGYGRVKAGRDLYIGGRLGFRAGDRALIYAKGGYTNARLDLTASDGTTETGQHFNLDGYRVGAGVEAALTPKTYAKIEYRYSNYGDARFEYPNGANTGNFDVDTDRHQIVAGLGVRF